jgi:hypothetical protein
MIFLIKIQIFSTGTFFVHGSQVLKIIFWYWQPDTFTPLAVRPQLPWTSDTSRSLILTSWCRNLSPSRSAWGPHPFLSDWRGLPSAWSPHPPRASGHTSIIPLTYSEKRDSPDASPFWSSWSHLPSFGLTSGGCVPTPWLLHNDWCGAGGVWSHALVTIVLVPALNSTKWSAAMTPFGYVYSPLSQYWIFNAYLPVRSGLASPRLLCYFRILHL